MNNKPFVSIIIPTYNDWERLSLCIKALSEQSYGANCFEIIIVNNALNDDMPDSFVCRNNCIKINETKPGSYAARNAGLKLAKGTIVGFTDSDCIPDTHWILNAVDYLEGQPGLYRVGGAVSVFYKGKKPTLGEMYDMVFAFPQKGYVTDLGWAVTANMFVRKDIFDVVGYFDSNLMSGGDFEWGQRARDMGYKIEYLPQSIVHHPARDSIKKLLIKVARTRKGSAEVDFKKGKVTIPPMMKQLYIIFRWRKEHLPYIKARIEEYKFHKRYAFFILLFQNIILGYGDFHYIKRKKELIKGRPAINS